ncbi:MAG: hypothetical protein IJH65_15330 [Methanobrevibacter sp.]|nr:hypothetical protein [Methanobrevibacter sp.]
MKFSVAITNPPYSNSLHLQIMEEVVKHCDKVINISPVRWLEDPMARYKKNSDYSKFEDSVSKKLEDLEVLNNKTSNELFDIEHSDLGIYVLGNGGYDYSKLSQMDSICQKIFAKCEKNKTMMDISTEEGYRGPHDGIFGVINSHRRESSRLISDKHELFVTYRETFGNKLIFFKSEGERDNCFTYLTSKTMKYYSSKIRKNQRVPWQFIPIVDFNKKCDDISLMEFFGFTKDEYNAILTFGA